MEKKYHFYILDLYRFIAALAVVLFHYTFRGYAGDNMSDVSFPLLADYSKYGYLGVDLFFMISGFVILLTAEKKNIQQFIISRIIRLYPVFWISMILTSIIILLLADHRYEVNVTKFIANLTMVSPLFGQDFVDGVYWSLFVELKFYFLIGLVLILSQINHIEKFLFLWILFSLYSLYFPVSGFLSFFLFPKWAHYFIAGSVLYLILKDGFTKIRILILCLAYFLSLKYAFLRLPHFKDHYNTLMSEFIIFTIITSFYLMIYNVSSNKIKYLNKSFFLYLGAITYPLYLVHQNIGFILLNNFHTYVNKYLLLVLIIVLMLFFSYIIHRYFEINISNRLKKLFNLG